MNGKNYSKKSKEAKKQRSKEAKKRGKVENFYQAYFY